MLSSLHIRGLGLIDEANLELGPGLVAITGETGAGKTMVVTGLGLLLGARADAGVVRVGADRAVVEGLFSGVDAVTPAVDALGGTVDDGELLASRQVSAAGRSRAFVGGAQVPVSSLAGVTGELATIHGQSEQVRLGTPERQREVLDRAAGPDHLRLIAGYEETFAERTRVLAELTDLRRREQERAREVDLLRLGLEEIAAAAPEPGEDEALRAESQRLQSADELRLLVDEALRALTGDPDADAGESGADALIVRAGRALARAARVDPGLAEGVEQLREVSRGLADAAGVVADYLSSLDADPARLEWVMERRAQLHQLTRKYGTTIDEVRAWAEESAARLATLEAGDTRVGELEDALERLDERVAELAGTISHEREITAARLGREVAAELSGLAMPRARLEFRLDPLRDPGPHGAERVTILFSANPGSQPAPLAKVASGGEMSRVRLALEVVVAREESEHTFVFDEVDAGVGGAVGLEIGRRLAALGGHGQVIVVTHLPQVAAFADRHLVVTKTSDEVTDSAIREVTGADREAELARMMTGLGDSASALAHAKDLLSTATKGRDDDRRRH